METSALRQKLWWSYLAENQRDLLGTSIILCNREEQGSINFHDYAFLVFPAAKAYEGFLKQLLFDLGLITKREYHGERFRIGKSLNPDLPKRLRSKSWVYDNLGRICQGDDLPRIFWDTWKNSRNLLFHWFPGHKNFISLEEAKERIDQIILAMDKGFEECHLKTKTPPITLISRKLL